MRLRGQFPTQLANYALIPPVNANVDQLAAALEQITSKLKGNSYPNEAAISTGVVLRVLQILGWEIYDPGFVWQEFSAGGRADFALCFPEKKPAVFIEVKQPGKVIGADKQLFEYAFHQGIPFAVLCDGRTWGFYLPSGQGTYDERRVYKLDLLERSPKEAAGKLIRYLEFERTKLGNAFKDATADLEDQNRRALSKQTIPKAWKDLVDGEDPSIVEKIASEVEGKCGVRPEVDDVMEFLLGLGVPKLSPAPSPTPVPQSAHTSVSQNHAANLPAAGQTQRGYQLNSKFVPCRTGVEVMIGVFKTLAASDPTFPEKCQAHPANVGKIRTYVASTTSELYPGRADLEEFSAEFTPGWYLATNLSNNMKTKVIRMAFSVAGLTENLNARFYL